MRKLILRYALTVLCVAVSGWVLLYASQSVQDARRELASIEAEIAAEKTRLAVLEAEWSYLNSPARLEGLAVSVLKMVPPKKGEAPVVSFLPQPPADPFQDAVLMPAAGGASHAP